MDLPVTYDQVKSFVATLALTQPRILAMFLVLPLFNTQLVPGLVNVWLMSPVALQLLHLLLTDLIWIGLVLLAASALGKPEARPVAAG